MCPSSSPSGLLSTLSPSGLLSTLGHRARWSALRRGSVCDVSETPDDPRIPARLTDPRPVLAIGTLAWAVATVVVLASGDRWASALPICWAGLAVGVLGTGLFVLQRRAARRGSRTAQRGLG